MEKQAIQIAKEKKLKEIGLKVNEFKKISEK